MRNLKLLPVIIFCLMPGILLKAQSFNFDQVDAHFFNPPNAFRIVHYSMNGPMDETVLDEMARYGIGGIQTSVPYNNYLQDEAGWDLTASFISQARERDFQVWIHDERGYPSGAAGGLVVEGHPEYEVRGLVRINRMGKGKGKIVLNLPPDIQFIRANIYNTFNGEPDLSSAKEVRISGEKLKVKGLNGEWQLSVFGEKILDANTQAQSTVEQFGQTGHYPSLLNKAACRRFIEMTHENYSGHLKPIEAFVDVFYTGEPNLMATYWQYDGSKAEYPYVPWEKSMIDAFSTMHGYDLMPFLDALFTGNSEQAQTVRLHYYQTIAELVAENYGGQVTAWCEENGVRSMGHPLLEEDIICHVFNYGDMIRFLREFHIQGCDLHIGRENNQHWIFWMGKYVGSAAYLDNKDTATIMGLLDPIIGLGMSDLTPEIPVLRRTVNMNLLCGLNQFTSYMPFNSTEDGYETEEYKAFNEYVGRIAMMLRGSWSEAPIAMYYPVKTFQSKYLATDKTWNLVTEEYRGLQNAVDELAREILENGLDFNFVTDDVLLKSTIENGKLIVGNHYYYQLVMPVTEVIPLNVLNKIQEIKAAGIPVHWVKALPQLGVAMQEHAEVKEIAKTLNTNNSPISDLQQIRNSEFSVVIETSGQNLSMARFRKENKRIYYIVNDLREEINLRVTSQNAKSLRLYNPVDGSIKEVNLPLSERMDGYAGLMFVEEVD